jgi:outer membrane receptor protein involved in Fe transport
MKTITKIFMLLCCAITYGQTNIKGTVTDNNGQPLPGASVIIVGTSTGAVSDFDGKFSFTYEQDPPFSVQASSLGFKTLILQVTSKSQTLDFVLSEDISELDEIVIAASRTPERIFESPVTVERLGINDIKNTPSVDFYSALEDLKGVDINTNSLTFRSVNTRGFATFANNRFMQLVDGMDNSTPALNFPIGNLVGMIETDVQSVELLPGASSALYGANAFNGILFMRSKNPFDHAGISAYYKQGITSQRAAGDNTYTDFGIRLAYKFSNKFAAKANFGYLKGTDWAANSEVDKNMEGGTRETNINYDGVNIYGDLVSTNIRAASGGLGIIPDVSVSRTGYKESDLTDYNAESVKADWGLYYRPFEDDFEISYVGKAGTGSTIYQGSNRYHIDGFFQEQHKLELKNNNFFLRGYIVADKAGDSYDMVATAVQINRAWKSDEQWFGDYISTYAGATLSGATDAEAHALARTEAETGRFLPGTPEFKAAFDRSISDPNLATGSKFQDASKYYHVDGNYNFSRLIDWADIQVGGSYRKYKLNSSGTIYTDTDAPIDYYEYGIYTQILKHIELNESLELKLTGSLRYDENQFFDGFFSPRLSTGLTLNKNHNFRASVQTGFRNPTTQDLFIGLDTSSYILIGSAPDNLDRYSGTYNLNLDGSSVVQTGAAAYNNSFTKSSTLQYLASIAEGNPDKSLLEVGNPNLVKPEKITSYEVGYRGKFKNLIIDFSAYYNSYKDFISQNLVRAPFYGTVGDDESADAIKNSDFKEYGIYTNSDALVNSYGASIGLSAKVFGNFDLGGSYTFAKLDFDQAKYPDFVTNFNTPEHKFKASFGNTELFTNFGFNISYRFADDYYWEATFGNGVIPEFHVVDAQINLKVPSLKSTFKAGATNLTGKEYYTAFGTGYIGSMYYLSWTINNL